MRTLYLPATTAIDEAARYEVRTGESVVRRFGGSGDVFLREPIGFPGSVTVSRSSGLDRHLALRLAKAAALAAHARGGSWRRAPLSVDVTSDRTMIEVAADKGIRIAVGAAYLSSRPGLYRLRGDMHEACRDSQTPSPVAEPVAKSSGIGPVGSVLLFRRLDVRPGAARRIGNATLCLAGALRQAGIPFAIIDWAYGEDPQALRARLAALSPAPSLVAITLLSESERMAAGLVARIHEACPDAVVALGGPAVSLQPEQVAAGIDGADIVVRGEGETILCELARRIGRTPRRELDAVDVDGLSGLLVFSPCFLRVRGLDHVNVHDGERIPHDLDSLDPRDVTEGPSLYLSRGCRQACSFCTSVFHGTVRGYAPAEVERFFRAYRDRLDVMFGGAPPPPALMVSFVDDDFLGDPDFAIATARTLHRLGLRISGIQIGIRTLLRLDEDRLRAFFDHDEGRNDYGVVSVNVGLENTVDEELAYLGKGYRYADVCAALDRLMPLRVAFVDVYRIDFTHFTTAAAIRTHRGRLAELQARYPRLVVESNGKRLNTQHAAPIFLKRIKAGGMEGLEVNEELSIRWPDFPELSLLHFRRDRPRDAEAAAFADHGETGKEDDA